MTISRVIDGQSPDAKCSKNSAPPTNTLAKRESSRPNAMPKTQTLPARSTSPSLTLPPNMPKHTSQPRSPMSPKSSSSFRAEQYSKMYPANVTSSPRLVTRVDNIKHGWKVDEKFQ